MTIQYDDIVNWQQTDGRHRDSKIHSTKEECQKGTEAQEIFRNLPTYALLRMPMRSTTS